MTDLQPHERLVLLCMADHAGDGIYLFFRGVAKHTGLTEKQAARAVRKLKRRGLVERSSVFDMDNGLIAGSGHGPTEAGIRVALALRLLEDIAA